MTHHMASIKQISGWNWVDNNQNEERVWWAGYKIWQTEHTENISNNWIGYSLFSINPCWNPISLWYNWTPKKQSLSQCHEDHPRKFHFSPASPRKKIRNRHLEETRLTAETIKCAALSLESIDDIEWSNRLTLGVLSICDGITDNTFKEGLENTSGLFVNHW